MTLKKLTTQEALAYRRAFFSISRATAHRMSGDNRSFHPWESRLHWARDNAETDPHAREFWAAFCAERMKQ